MVWYYLGNGWWYFVINVEFGGFVSSYINVCVELYLKMLIVNVIVLCFFDNFNNFRCYSLG